MYQHHYKSRDFTFAQHVLMLRKRARLTQRSLAEQCGVSEKAMRNWESGTNYPSDEHLQRLTEVLFSYHIFTVGQEREEVYALWDALQKHTSRHFISYDEQWLAALLEQQRRDEPPAIEYPLFLSYWSSFLAGGSEIGESDLFSSLPQNVSAQKMYGRIEIEAGQLQSQCLLVAVQGIDITKQTTLVIHLAPQATA